MNLFWLLLPSDMCSFDELQKRQCVAIGWSEIGTLEKYIRVGKNWERRFKSYVQLRGDLAYGRNPSWKKSGREFDQVPHIFWQLLAIEQGDMIVAVESGKEITYGRPVIRGVGQIKRDALGTYSYDKQYRYAHTVCPETQWIAWDNFTMGELQLPETTFRTLLHDNSQTQQVVSAIADKVDSV